MFSPLQSASEQMRKSRAMNIRALITALLLVSSAVSVEAQRNTLKPSDFEPLTSLPWKKPDATLEGVLDTIFRDPNPAIRYPVLAEYLRTIPVGQLGKAFDLCIDLEGTQTPDDLVEFFLPIWAKRDPKACWKRTRELFRVVGIEAGWLGYDNWGERPRITVQDLAAIRASRFWLTRRALLSFPGGVDESALPKPGRVLMMKEFADVWFRAFGSWPGYPRPAPRYSYGGRYPEFSSNLIETFGKSPAEVQSYVKDAPNSGDRYEGAFIVAARQWLQAEPASAPEIIKLVEKRKWPPDQHSSAEPTDLFLVWAKVDLAAMIRWTESLDPGKDDLILEARGFLMSRVDSETRDRWLAEVSAEPESDDLIRLLERWAVWDPKAALDAAVATNDAEIAWETADRATFGYWSSPNFNTRHFALGVIKDFDAARLPESYRKEHFMNWEEIMETWGDVDIGEAARYGLDFMLRNDYAPRENLIKLFSGDDQFAVDGEMIDRTFCSMRVWAVVKPNAMKAWIATLQDAEMRKALTWLLDHPWGTGPTE